MPMPKKPSHRRRVTRSVALPPAVDARLERELAGLDGEMSRSGYVTMALEAYWKAQDKEGGDATVQG